MRKLLAISLTALVLTAQTPSSNYSNQLSLELQSLIVGTGNGIPTQLVINSGGGNIAVINLPKANSVSDPGVDWSDPFSTLSIWQVQRQGITYTLRGDTLLNFFKWYGLPTKE